MSAVRHRILLALILGLVGGTTAFGQTPTSAPVPAPTETLQAPVVTQAPVVEVPVTQTPVVVGEPVPSACPVECSAASSGKCESCSNCIVVETTKKKTDKEIHGKCKDICWPCSCPITTIWALICHEKPQYVCKGRTIHVQMKKTITTDVPVTVCKTPEQIAEDAKKQSAAAPASLPIRRSGL